MSSKYSELFVTSAVHHQCSVCSSKFAIQTDKGVSHLRRHLLAKHPQQLKDLEDSIELAKSAASSSRDVGVEITSYFKTTAKRKAVDDSANVSESSRSSTPSIPSALTRWNEHGDGTAALDRAVALFIARDMVPYSVVDRQGFRNLLRIASPKYRMKSRHTFARRIVPELNAEIKLRVSDLINSAESLVITYDLWSDSLNNHSLLGVLAHFIDGQWSRQTVCLGCLPVTGSHGSADLKITPSNLPQFSPDEWDAVSQLVTVLKPVRELTVLVQSRDSCLSAVIPVLKLVTDHLQGPELDPSVDLLKQALRKSLAVRGFKYIDNDLAVLSMLLDPNFKDSFTASSMKSKLVTAAVIEARNIYTADTPARTDQTFDDDSDNPFARFLRAAGGPRLTSSDTEDSSAKSKATKEVNSFLSKPPFQCDPLSYWKKEGRGFPVLSALARKYLALPASSSEVERLFSCASLISTDLRKRLTNHSLEKLLFTRYNLLLLGFEPDDDAEVSASESDVDD